MAGNQRKRAPARLFYLLLLLPLAALWVPFYNRLDPVLLGIPFFYWMQMLWIVMTVFVLYVVYRLERRHGDRT